MWTCRRSSCLSAAQSNKCVCVEVRGSLGVCLSVNLSKARSNWTNFCVHTDLSPPLILRVFVLHHCVLYLSWRQSATFFLLLFFPSEHSSFSESVAGRDHFVLLFMATSFLSFSVFCTVLFSLSLSLFLSLAVVLLPLPPFSLTLLLSHSRSVPPCARSVSRALTSRCDPTGLRWLWYSVQPSW